jgi:predicted transcriptional regulator
MPPLDREGETSDANRAPVRRRVLDAIAERPGIHMRDLERAAQVSLSSVAHHTRRLEAEGKIIGVFDGHYRRFFLSSLSLPTEARRLTDTDRRLLSEFRRPVPLAIVLNLAVDGPLHHRDLEERLGRAKGTISYHLSRLEAQGIVTSPRGSIEGYRLTDPLRSIVLLVTFSGSLRDHVDQFAHLWRLLGTRAPR